MKKVRLEFYSETGTEGGYWAVYDESFTEIKASSYGHWPNLLVYDADDHERIGKVVSSKLSDGRVIPDPLSKDPLYHESSLFMGIKRGSKEADETLANKYGFKIEYLETWCKTDPHRPYGVSPKATGTAVIQWDDGLEEERDWSTLHIKNASYEGLHLLKDGDKLKIFKENSEEIEWEGTIKLKSHDLFSEDASGYWIHADQEGIDRDIWANYFFKEFKAEWERPE